MTGCCGQPVRARRLPTPIRLPSNPRIANGLRLLYLGSGLRELRGTESGLVYHVADQRRDFVADRADVNGLLRNRFVILRP
jgi:hypothetical protein